MEGEKLSDKGIIELFNGGSTMKQIAEAAHMSIYDVKYVIRKFRRQHPEEAVYKYKRAERKPKEPTIIKEKMTPREMIKALYDLGYRIEDNQLVIYQRQVVKIGDVVNNG